MTTAWAEEAGRKKEENMSTLTVLAFDTEQGQVGNESRR
jgi:hypothetical protein